MDLLTLVRTIEENGELEEVAFNPLAQFGTPARGYLGAEILPERNVESNTFREGTIRYRTVIANSGTRFSPVQIKRAGASLIGSMLVELGESDIGDEMTGRDYDALRDLLRRTGDMEAIAAAVRWASVHLNDPLLMLNERQRWDVIVNAQTVRVGDNEYRETVAYPNPTGHRTIETNSWSARDANGESVYDPFETLMAIAAAAAAKGYNIARMVCRQAVVSLMAQNTHVQRRVYGVRPDEEFYGGLVIGLPQINAICRSLGLPEITTYDAQYATVTGSGFFVPAGTMVFTCATGQDETIEPEDGDPVYLRDTLGYHAVGRAAGQDASGRVLLLTPYRDKPPRIEGQAWQTAFPVIQDPEAVYTLSGIA